MENVIERVKVNQIEARRNKDSFGVSFQSTLMAEIVSVGKRDNRETTNDEAIDVVKKFLKGVNETISFFEKFNNDGNDNKALETLNKEKQMLEAYLPTMATAEEIRSEVAFLKASGAGNVGAIMKGLKEKFGSALDGKLASSIAKG